MPTDGGAPAKSAQERDVAAITRAAEWAVTNKYLTALTRFATPICIAAVGWVYTSVTSLVAVTQEHHNKVAAFEQRITDLNAANNSLRLGLSSAREQLIRLQAAQETTQALGRRLDEFRDDLRDIRRRLDQIALPNNGQQNYRYTPTPQ